MIAKRKIESQNRQVASRNLANAAKLKNSLIPIHLLLFWPL
jgi:hypothetical protein